METCNVTSASIYRIWIIGWFKSQSEIFLVWLKNFSKKIKDLDFVTWWLAVYNKNMFPKSGSFFVFGLHVQDIGATGLHIITENLKFFYWRLSFKYNHGKTIVRSLLLYSHHYHHYIWFLVRLNKAIAKYISLVIAL